ncbi:DddA-like double-stranded DNA deaminase toxin [Actinopolyspora halophila]|uniref:DddA-like double-stranded DNA deaminase toxin n=1 Tax=Actinopolyspora halophila TaxID=1850 RepID=UPI00037D4992|nr:DddA-like double-stranded DNA deaminase toxin [Actinopolyspora halophila]
MSHVEELGNTLGGMLGRVPPEQLHQARAWIEEYALPTLAEIGQGSTSPDLAEAVALLERARDLIDDVLALSNNTRTHLINYLAELGLNTDQPPPSLPHPSTLPRVPTDTARDRSWIDQIRERLPEHTGGQTTGLVHDQDGNELQVNSGRDPKLSEQARLILHNSELFPTDDRGEPTVTMHVEVKYALMMRKAGQTYGVVVLNNELCRGCEKAVPGILPQGATLVVWHPGTPETITLRGKARP